MEMKPKQHSYCPMLLGRGHNFLQEEMSVVMDGSKVSEMVIGGATFHAV
jgi:hypothetical protein